MLRGIVIAGLLLALPLVVACGDDDDDDGNGEASEVAITLREWSVGADPASVKEGDVTFTAENVGPDDPHELVVVKTDLAPGDLPTREDGGVDEDGEGIEIIGEIEEFAVGETHSATWDLEAGDYVLICNIVEEEDGELEAHYALGMRLAFTVED